MNRSEPMILGRRPSSLVLLLALLWGCDDMAFRVGTAVQSGRQALLRKDCVQALPHFEEAARLDPNYVYRSAHFSQGIWSDVGRCQYAAGALAQARQSLELALTKDKDDIIARLYLGATLLREGDDTRGRDQLRGAPQSLHDWIENLLTSRSAESYGDPNKQIRSEIKKALALMAPPGGARAELLTNAEWLGAEIEEAIERVRREESQRKG